jgi:uncharacterized protein (DUF1697 family)
MIYVAFLRAINVGGNSIVSMAAIKEALVTMGMSNVRTYLNSGNVVFATRATDRKKLATRIETALEQRTGMEIKALVMDHKVLRKLVDAIPEKWVDDKKMRTYVLLLWKELDDRQILERLPTRAGVDNVRYAPGAVIWNLARKDLGKSRMNRLVGTPDYKKITMRSANTIRKLNELTVGSGASARPPA